MHKPTLKNFAIFASLLLGTVTLALGQTSSTLDEDLRHSQFCAKAAAEFRKRPEWSKNDDPHTFTNHFNRTLNKCLVKVKSSNIVREQKSVLEAEHVYDALEGTVLGGRITTKELPHNGEQKTLGILMVRDGKTLGKANMAEAREAYAWFDTLMTD